MLRAMGFAGMIPFLLHQAYEGSSIIQEVTRDQKVKQHLPVLETVVEELKHLLWLPGVYALGLGPPPPRQAAGAGEPHAVSFHQPEPQTVGSVSQTLCGLVPSDSTFQLRACPTISNQYWLKE